MFEASCKVKLSGSTHLSPPAFTHSDLLPWLASTDLETLVATKTMVWVAEAGRGPVVAMAGFGGVCFLTAHSPDGCLFGIHREKHVLQPTMGDGDTKKHTPRTRHTHTHT